MMRRGLVAGLMVLLACSTRPDAVYAQSGDAPADWIKRPRAEDLMAVWPREAWRRGLGGQATISCQVSVQGALHGCAVVSESPSGAGFGAAAIALTPQFLMKPEMKGGKAVVSTVRIPINFQEPSIATGSHIAGDRGQGAGLTRLSLSRVTWRAAPEYAQVAAAYPAKARAAAVGGRATLSCNFKSEGRVGSCQTIAEEPKGQGFATAARQLLPHFIGPEALSDGRSTSGVNVQIPFVFAPEMLDPQKRLIGKPQWVALPTGDAFAAGYPPAAVKAGVGVGRVALLCQVVAEGRLGGCELASEEPAGLGFGAAALALVKAFQVQTWTAEGLPTIGGKIRVPIRYQLPAAAAAKPQ